MAPANVPLAGPFLAKIKLLATFLIDARKHLGLIALDRA